MFLESGQFNEVMKFSMNCLGSNVPKPANTASQMFEVIYMIYWTPYSRTQWEKQDIGEGIQWKQEDVPLYNELKNFLLPISSDLIKQLFSFLDSGKAETAKNNIEDCLMAIGLAFPEHAQQIWLSPLQQLGEDILTRT